MHTHILQKQWNYSRSQSWSLSSKNNLQSIINKVNPAKVHSFTETSILSSNIIPKLIDKETESEKIKLYLASRERVCHSNRLLSTNRAILRREQSLPLSGSVVAKIPVRAIDRPIDQIITISSERVHLSPCFAKKRQAAAAADVAIEVGEHQTRHCSSIRFFFFGFWGYLLVFRRIFIFYP